MMGELSVGEHESRQCRVNCHLHVGVVGSLLGRFNLLHDISNAKTHVTWVLLLSFWRCKSIPVKNSNNGHLKIRVVRGGTLNRCCDCNLALFCQGSNPF